MEYDLIAKKYEISVHISRTLVIHNLVIKGPDGHFFDKKINKRYCRLTFYMIYNCN